MTAREARTSAERVTKGLPSPSEEETSVRQWIEESVYKGLLSLGIRGHLPPLIIQRLELDGFKVIPDCEYGHGYVIKW